MIINTVCESYIDYAARTNLDKAEAVELYYKGFTASNNSLMDHYFKYFMPSNKHIIDDKIYKHYLHLKKHYDMYNHLCEFKIDNRTIQKLLSNFPYFKNILKYTEINLLMGIGTAQGFVTYENNKGFINIAIEKFVDLKEPYKAMECTIIHELIHLARIKNNKGSWDKLGYYLLEEGLACLLSKAILNLADDEDDLVFPQNIRLSDEEFNKFTNLYLENIHCEDSNTIKKFMHSGDSSIGIPSGLGYTIGARLLSRYIDHKNADVYEMIYAFNDTIVNQWLELKDRLKV